MDFWKDLAQNKEMADELLDKLSAAEEEIRAEKRAEKDKVIIEFAKSKGYEVTQEDMELAKAKAARFELSEEDAKLLAAAANYQEMTEFCVADYLCRAMWNTCMASNECFGLLNCDEALARPTYGGPANCFVLNQSHR